ncbi:unnamed protein product [Sympodiomycopsis kandeliae]
MSAISYPSVPAGSTHATLNTGAKIPLVGLGTWQSAPGEVAKAVETSLRAGYRHLDCAFIYGNETEVGQGIRASGVPRSEIFVTTKLWGTFHRIPEEGLDLSLSRLGLDYVDLYLMHWPVAMRAGPDKIPLKADGTRDLDLERKFTDTWKDMAQLVKSGKAKAIGVSNVSKPLMEELLKNGGDIVPAANQIELHPYLPQHDLVTYLQSKGIVAQAYSPLGSTGSPLLKEPVVVEIAKAHNADPGQIVLSWGAQRGVTVLPKSVTPSRIEGNLKTVSLSDEEMKRLDELSQQDGKAQRFIKPNWGFDLQFDDWH